MSSQYKYRLSLITGEKKEIESKYAPDELDIVYEAGAYSLISVTTEEIVQHACYEFELIVGGITEKEQIRNKLRDELLELFLFFILSMACSFLAFQLLNSMESSDHHPLYQILYTEEKYYKTLDFLFVVLKVIVFMVLCLYTHRFYQLIKRFKVNESDN